MIFYIVLSIGCIECGDENEAEELVKGVFRSKADAVVFANVLREKYVAYTTKWADENGVPADDRYRLRAAGSNSPCGGFSMSDWQVRVAEVSV